MARKRWWNQKPTGVWVDVTPRVASATTELVLLESALGAKTPIKMSDAVREGAKARLAMGGFAIGVPPSDRLPPAPAPLPASSPVATKPKPKPPPTPPKLEFEGSEGLEELMQLLTKGSMRAAAALAAQAATGADLEPTYRERGRAAAAAAAPAARGRGAGARGARHHVARRLHGASEADHGGGRDPSGGAAAAGRDAGGAGHGGRDPGQPRHPEPGQPGRHRRRGRAAALGQPAPQGLVACQGAGVLCAVEPRLPTPGQPAGDRAGCGDQAAGGAALQGLRRAAGGGGGRAHEPGRAPGQ